MKPTVVWRNDGLVNVYKIGEHWVYQEDHLCLEGYWRASEARRDIEYTIKQLNEMWAVFDKEWECEQILCQGIKWK